MEHSSNEGMVTLRYSDFLDEDGKIDEDEFMKRVRQSRIAVFNPDGSVSLIGPTTNPKMLM